nr:MAG TPA_asm: hypothetical protein [Caudoviricetes sp.]
MNNYLTCGLRVIHAGHRLVSIIITKSVSCPEFNMEYC